MHDSEEYVACPCETCLLYALCMHKTIEILVSECQVLSKYLIKTCTGKRIVLNLDNFYTFCKVMDITTSHHGHNIKLKYKRGPYANQYDAIHQEEYSP
jgi:hypothetical protein